MIRTHMMVVKTELQDDAMVRLTLHGLQDSMATDAGPASDPWEDLVVKVTVDAQFAARVPVGAQMEIRLKPPG